MNIVIVGGGTAGWLAALQVSKIYKNIHNVTLIESSSIGIIGAGESSTGALRGIINNEVWDYGCNEMDFMKFSKATPKLALLHKNWLGDESSYLAPIDINGEDIDTGTNSLLTAYISKNIPMQMASINGRLETARLSDFYTDGNEIKSINRHAYNFDARLAAKYLEIVCGNGVKKIDAKIIKINFSDNGFVQSLTLHNDTEIPTDFVIDASGFSRIFSDKMNVTWIDYPELTLDSAMPFILPYQKDYNLRLIATAWAQKNGWLWQIPKGDDLGNGYAYDSNYISDDEAQREIEQLLGTEIKPIKFIKYKAGRLKTLWNKNVLSIGLSASFLEPLEATSVHASIIQMNYFIFTFLKETAERTVNENSIKVYNRNMEKMLENFKNFILLHYCNDRKDSNFWLNCTRIVKNNEFIKEILEISQSRLLNRSDIESFFGQAGAELHNWILCGLGKFSQHTAIKEISILNRINKAKIEEIYLTEGFDKYKWLTNNEIFKVISEHNVSHLGIK